MKKTRRISVTNLNLESNLMFQLNAPVAAPFALMTTGAFSRNIGKLFPELKLVTDNLPLRIVNIYIL